MPSTVPTGEPANMSDDNACLDSAAEILMITPEAFLKDLDIASSNSVLAKAFRSTGRESYDFLEYSIVPDVSCSNL
jgi:hypothetical protein